MNDNEKLVLWGILVVLLLIIIGIINPFLLILILSIFIYNHKYSLIYKVNVLLEINTLANWLICW